MDSTALTPSQTNTLATEPRDLVALWHSQLAADVAAGQMAADTAATYRRGLSRFQQWGAAQNQPADTATRNLIKAWLAELRTEGRSVATISIWLSSVRAFFQWAVSEGYASIDPTAGVKAGKRSGANRSHKRDVLTDNEMMRVLSLPDLSTRDRAILHLFAFTACRGIEIHRAMMRDVHTRDEYLAINVQGKGRDEADDVLIVASKQAEAALRDWIGQRGTRDGALFTAKYGGEIHALSRRQLRGIVRAAFLRAGVVDKPTRRKTTHSLRHTAITKARRNGASLEETQRMARHSNIATTQIYDHARNRVEQAAERHIDYAS